MSDNRDKLCEMLDSGELNPLEVAKWLLRWLSEDDCTEWAIAHGIELESEDESEDESDPAQPNSTSN